MSLPRLRQVVLAAHDLEAVATDLETFVGVHDPFHDDGVGHFGLRNAVYVLGDTFLEIVSPRQPDTAAGRYLDRHGGDCGYMAMFEVADAGATRARLGDLSVRTVWETVHDDITDLHLHPKDVGGAIVALDITSPPGSWRWGGPAWVGQVPAYGTGAVVGMTVGALDPDTTARRWSAVLDAPMGPGTSLRLEGGAQHVTFMPASDPAGEGIVGVDVTVDGPVEEREIGGVRFRRGPDVTSTRGQHQ
jgi:hypothetical protein